MTDKEIYYEFSLKNNIPVLSTGWWLEAVTEGKWDVKLVKKNNQILTSLPFMVNKSFGFIRYINPNLTNMLHLYHFKNVNQRKSKQNASYNKHIAELTSQLTDANYIQLNLDYQFTNWQPFYWANYNQQTRYSYVLDIEKKSVSELLNSFSKEIKEKIQLGEQNLKLVESSNIDELFELNCLSFERQKYKSPYSFSIVKSAFEAASQNQRSKLFFALNDAGKLQSGLWIVWDHNSAYHIISGFDPNTNEDSGINFLFWTAIKKSKNELNLSKFDFQGSMIKGIAESKRGFQADLIPFSQIWKSNSKLYSSLNLIKNMFN